MHHPRRERAPVPLRVEIRVQTRERFIQITVSASERVSRLLVLLSRRLRLQQSLVFVRAASPRKHTEKTSSHRQSLARSRPRRLQTSSTNVSTCRVTPFESRASTVLSHLSSASYASSSSMTIERRAPRTARVAARLENSRETRDAVECDEKILKVESSRQTRARRFRDDEETRTEIAERT